MFNATTVTQNQRIPQGMLDDHRQLLHALCLGEGDIILLNYLQHADLVTRIVNADMGAPRVRPVGQVPEGTPEAAQSPARIESTKSSPVTVESRNIKGQAHPPGSRWSPTEKTGSCHPSQNCGMRFPLRQLMCRAYQAMNTDSGAHRQVCEINNTSAKVSLMVAGSRSGSALPTPLP